MWCGGLGPDLKLPIWLLLLVSQSVTNVVMDIERACIDFLARV